MHSNHRIPGHWPHQRPPSRGHHDLDIIAPRMRLELALTVPAAVLIVLCLSWMLGGP